MAQEGRAGRGRVQIFLFTRPVKIGDCSETSAHTISDFGESPKRKNTVVHLKNIKPTICHLLYLLYFLDTQHVSGINMSIFRNLRLCCGSARVVSGLTPAARIQAQLVLQPAARIPPQPNRTLTPSHSNPRAIQPMW